jgi:hypothetical protein
MLVVESDPAILPIRLGGHRPPPVEKWIDAKTT